MKINIDLDITPAELREAIGLPEVKEVQDRWISKIEGKVEDEIEKLSPELIAQRWVGALAPNPDLMNTMMQMMPGMTKK